MSIVLYVPPDNRLDILAPSVGGTIPPMWGRMRRYHPPDYEVFTPDPWMSLVHCPDWPKFPERALLLSIDGTPDEIGVSRAYSALGMITPFPLDMSRVDEVCKTLVSRIGGLYLRVL